MDTLAIVLRVILSLAVVGGLLWLCHRIARGTQRTTGSRDSITVVSRQGLTQKSAAVLIDSGTKRYLLGVTEGGISLLDTMERPAPATSATEFAAALDTVHDSGQPDPQALWVPRSATRAGEPAVTPAEAPLEPEQDITDLVSARPGTLSKLRGGLGQRATWRNAARQVLKGRAA